MKNSYYLHVCPTCGEQHQFAGFCDTCNTRLTQIRAIPAAVIEKAREDFVQASSVVPAHFIRHFVDYLLRQSG